MARIKDRAAADRDRPFEDQRLEPGAGQFGVLREHAVEPAAGGLACDFDPDLPVRPGFAGVHFLGILRRHSTQYGDARS